MRLTEALRGLLPCHPGAVIALVGAGGKTSALFGLAAELAEGSPGGVLLTTTTQIVDPRTEAGREFDQLVLDPVLARAPGEAPESWPRQAQPGPGRRVVLASGTDPVQGKLLGVHPGRFAGLGLGWSWVLVEADGSRKRPVKAPAEHEPVLPVPVDLVLGVIGLTCLGQPMDAGSVHRPELFGPLTGCARGAPIGCAHLAALVASPHGLFQGVPAGVPRVLLLNQADRYPGIPEGLLGDLCDSGPVAADRVLVCALGDARPGARVLARMQGATGRVVTGDAPCA